MGGIGCCSDGRKMVNINGCYASHQGSNMSAHGQTAERQHEMGINCPHKHSNNTHDAQVLKPVRVHPKRHSVDMCSSHYQHTASVGMDDEARGCTVLM